jgi:hypothetical protein
METIVDKEVQRRMDDIANRPEEILRRSIHNCTNILQKQVDKRIKIEAEHGARMDDIKARHQETRTLIQSRIFELEEQLKIERTAMARSVDLEETDVMQETRRFETYDAAQRKLIRAAEVMLAELKAP